MRSAGILMLFLFGVGHSESVNENYDDGLALLQTKLVKQHTDMSRAAIPVCTARDIPETMRQASTIFNGDAIGHSHGTGRLDSSQAWSSQNNQVGEWYQMDNGVVGKITGVAIKGRHGTGQRVTSFKVQSKGDTGTWADVDNGRVYTGNTDSETKVDVIFGTHVNARYIRIYPQTWNEHMSMRVDIVAKCSGCGLHDIPDTMRQASTIFNGDAMGYSHGTGRLDSTQAWSSQNNQVGEWYQMDNGAVGKITGVAIKGRHGNGQRVTSFKVQSTRDTGTWADVDNGRVYTGNTDSETQVDAIFGTPVDARYIRIYPQTWNEHMSMRADIMVKCGSPSGGSTEATTTTPASGVSTETTTTIPGGDTNVGGADCFGAIATFGPDFECDFKVSSFCEHDSADGLDVSTCCQDYCNSNREKTTKRKVSEREDKTAEGVRKSDRQESSSKRKDAESSRKKNKREEEWLQKRGAQEASNKKAEDEKKTAKGYSESKTKNERSWKANRQSARKNAQRREVGRKSERALKAQNNETSEGKKKKRASTKEVWAKKKKGRKEKRLKKKSKGR